MEKTLKLKEFRNYISRIDRISICFYETMEYHNYMSIKEVPRDSDDLIVYGVGMIESEFFEDQDGKITTQWKKENLRLLPCIEIILTDKSKKKRW